MTTRKLTAKELESASAGLADIVCRLEDAKQRKATLTAEINREMKLHQALILKLAQEVNSGEVEVDPQGQLL